MTECFSMPKPTPGRRVAQLFVSKAFAYRFCVFSQLWQFAFCILQHEL